jgi:hypothetical protein
MKLRLPSLPSAAALALALVLLGSFAPLSAATPPPQVAESFSLELRRVPFNHQGPQLIDLTLKLSYVAGIGDKEYPDFEAVRTEVLAFLKDYPNETDYTEVVNRKLCLALLARHKPVASVSVDLHTHPTMTIPYDQISHCVATR